jgi:hypothetical protein
MNKRFLLPAACILALAACQTNSKETKPGQPDSIAVTENPETRNEAKAPAASNATGVDTSVYELHHKTQQFGYVTDIREQGGKTILQYTGIELYYGAEAVKAARKDHRAAYDSATGQYSLPDNIYMTDKRWPGKTVSVAAGVKVQLVSNAYREEGFKVEADNFDNFKKVYRKDKYWPVKMTLNAAGEVSRIEQVYLP